MGNIECNLSWKSDENRNEIYEERIKSLANKYGLKQGYPVSLTWYPGDKMVSYGIYGWHIPLNGGINRIRRNKIDRFEKESIQVLKESGAQDIRTIVSHLPI